MSGGAGDGQGGRSALADDKSLAVVLVSYNSAGVIREAITSVDEDCEVIVVDNASEDDLEGVLRGTGVRIIRNAANVGFGTACNIGAQAVSAAFLLFLNPDARLEPGALAKLLARAKADPWLGALNPRIIDGNGNVWQRRHSRLLDKGANDRVKRTLTQDCDIEMLSGAALFCRTDAFEQIGGFDDKIFLFCEDDDLAIRLKAAGYRLGYVHDAVVHHARGGSSASSPALDRFKAYHFMRSGWYGCLKHGLEFNRSYQIALCSWKYTLGWVKLDMRQRAKYAGYLKALREPSPDVDA